MKPDSCSCPRPLSEGGTVREWEATNMHIRTRITDHDFLPVNGHSDDDECAYRADGTDATYCGESEQIHGYDECTDWTQVG